MSNLEHEQSDDAVPENQPDETTVGSVRDWTRPPEWQPVDKAVRHRMSNRVRKARLAITRLAETGAPQMLGWLQDVAEGIPKRDFKGEPIRDGQGSIVWLLKPDPLGAFKGMADVMSYHLPRLKSESVEVVAKVEQTGPLDFSQMTTHQLQILLAEKLCAIDPTTIIDAELVERNPAEPMPAWLEPNRQDEQD